MTTADDLTAVWEGTRDTFEDAFFADTYAIVRMVRTSDGSGGDTVAPETVETGRCSLYPNRAQGREFQTEATTVAQAEYAAEFPWATTIVPTDAVTINDRAFDVVIVKREGAWGVSVIVELEERT